MATEAEDAATTLKNVTAKLAEVSKNLSPNITVDGVTIDRAGYYRMLLDMQKAAREQLRAASGGFCIDEYR